METPLVSDALWHRIHLLLPPPRPRRFRCPGRKPLDARKILRGILHVLRTGVSWGRLPPEMGCGCGISCWKYLRAWQQSGTWPRIRALLQKELPDADHINWARAEAEVDRASVPSGGATWPNPSLDLNAQGLAG